jgi:RNA polymerase sigma-70 factor (ECF subfamily)
MDEAGVLIADRKGPPRGHDEELAVAARTDAAAFGVLYERHRLAVYRYLRTRTASAEDAADLTGLTFERALAAMPRYRPSGGGLLAWLLRIARNAAIDAGRRAVSVPLDPAVHEQIDTELPETGVLAAERRAALASAINRLPDVQREAIALRYTAGLTAREIGAVVGKSEQATQKLLSRAIAAIRESCRDDL